MSIAAKYHGLSCAHCGETLRYVSNRNCVKCSCAHRRPVTVHTGPLGRTFTAAYIVRFIFEYVAAHGGVSPTEAEICAAIVGVHSGRPLSGSVVNHHLNQLEDQGVIERVGRENGRRAGNIRIVGAELTLPPLPEWARE